jgi:CRP-like cAMP-binding protein
MDTFTAYMKSKTSLSDKAITQIRSVATPMRLKRKELYLRQGETCRGYAFVLKGCFRVYRPGKDGTLHILRFSIENWWLCEMESIELQEPAKHSIEALETSDILFWTKEDLNMLRSQLPAFDALFHQLKSRTIYANQQRIFAGLSFSAEEKYRDFLDSYPEIVNRVPLHMVASYLGITRKTISRIRAAHR